MKACRINIKVRYDEVDRMGFVYHGNYAKYYHISRTELLRSIDINDKSLEEQGIIMPVTEMNVKYIKPVFYDDMISVETTLDEITGLKLNFSHLVFNADNEIINKAKSTLVFVNAITRRVIRVPGDILNKLQYK
jgi:acyl-CoA thioester hydrolase